MQLRQYSQLIEGAYHHTYARDLDLKSGLQFQFINNTNLPETGVLPLIPDYQSVKPSLYSILQKAWGKKYAGRWAKIRLSKAFGNHYFQNCSKNSRSIYPPLSQC
ncbi:MAG: hypothetical protein IPI77_24380 [Saprospiraceae bacterium]|nr:hypothetical protein [Saprospiraceae bacterium]